MFCSNCGFKMEPGAGFCAGCGTARELVSEAVVPQEDKMAWSHEPVSMSYELQPPPKKKVPIWAPIGASAVLLCLVVGMLFFFGVLGSDDDYDAANEDSSIDSVVDSAVDIEGQPLVADEQGSANTFLQELEEQVGVLRKGDIPPEEESDELSDEPVAIHANNEWVDLNVTSFEYFGGDDSTVIMRYELVNNYDLNIELRDIEIVHNGEVLDMTVLTIRFEYESVVQRRIDFRERNAIINSGDVLIIRATVRVNDDDNEQGRWIMEDLGRVEVVIPVGTINPPGSSVTMLDHIDIHGDMMLMISELEIREETDRRSAGATIEFLKINRSEYETALDQIYIYINGTPLTEDEGYLGMFLHTDYGTAARRMLILNDIELNYGDMLIVRGRLRVVYDAANVTQETVTFWFFI